MADLLRQRRRSLFRLGSAVAVSDPFVDELIALLPRLRRFAISLSGSRDVADELVQATCERALVHRASFEPGTRLDAWTMRILRNLWTDRLRSPATRETFVDVDDAYYLVGEDGEARSEARLKLAEVAKAIGALPDQQREVLLLVCVEDYSYRETAEILSIPIGTVMSRLARARAALESLLE